jgi:four helix bundle protein
MQTQLEIAKNISYLKEYDFNNLYEDSREVERMLVSFIKKIKDRN